MCFTNEFCILNWTHAHRLKCCLSRSSYTRKVFICSLYSEGSVGCFALQHQAVHTCILWDEAFITGLHKDRREVAGFHHLQDDCIGGKLIRVHFLKCLRRQRGNVFGERSTLQNNGSIIIWENERMSFIGRVCLHIRGICYSDRSSTVQQNDSDRTRHR